MTSSLNKSKTAGYRACIHHIIDAGYSAAQAHVKDLAAKPRKTMDELAFIDGFSQALENTKALALAPERSRREP